MVCFRVVRGPLSNAVGRCYIQRHGDRLNPEARLIILYPATCILAPSLVLLGLAFEFHWHYMTIAVFATLQCFGVMIVTTVINAYLLDCYPEASGEASAWVMASRNWAGFMSTYIQIQWVEKGGPAWPRFLVFRFIKVGMILQSSLDIFDIQ